MDIFQLKIK